MESQKHREFKLAIPLEFEIVESHLVVKDRFKNTNSISISPNVSFKISNPDADGYVLFDISIAELPKTKLAEISPQSEAHINGYTLFHSSVARSISYGDARSIYQYYKRDKDLAYYALIKKDGKPDKKILLGSMLDANSRIFQVTRIIEQKFPQNTTFDKRALKEHLPSPFTTRGIMKSVLDVLVKEGYLDSKDVRSKYRNSSIETFLTKEKLYKFMADPRSWQKPSGFNVGSLATTSNH